MKCLPAFASPTLLLILSLAAPSSHAQTPVPAPPAAPVASGTASATGRQRQVVLVDRLPASAAAAPKSRASTAGAGGSREKPTPHKLPDLTVLNRDRSSVALSSLAHKDHWLLLLRTANCIPCDRLMNKLTEAQGSALQSGSPLLVVVLPSGPNDGIGSAGNGMEKLRGSYSAFSSATWVADPQRSTLVALKATGTPMLYGMNGTDIAWRVAGGLGTDVETAELVNHWLTTTTPAKPMHTTAEPVAKTTDPTTTTSTGSVVATPQTPTTSVPKP